MSLESQLKDIRNDPVKFRFALAIGFAILATLVAFHDAIFFMLKRWGEQEELSHSYFIPFISGWLVWSNRDAVMKSVGSPSIIAVYLGALAAIFLLLAPVTYTFLLQDIGLIIAIAAIVTGIGGLSLLRITAIPIAFLLFAVPPPYWAITTLSWNFQNMSSELGVAMIELMNIPVHLSGNIIDLGVIQLQVAEACSGLRYLFPFLSLGFLTAYLFKAPLWQRIIVFLSTIPITIFMNSLRIAITGALVQAYGASHTEGFLHFFEGWVVFLLCLLALAGVIGVFCLIVPPRRHILDAVGVPELEPVLPKEGQTQQFIKPAFLGIIGALVLTTMAGTKFLTIETLIVPKREIFTFLPFEFPDFEHKVVPIDSEIAEVLAADDSIVIDLVSPDGNLFNIYLAYLEARRDGSSWHSPRQCIPGGGWQITSLDIIQGSDEPGTLPFAYNRMVIEANNQKQIVYYWYDQRGRKIANEYVMKASVIYDTVTRRRADGALVRVMATVPRSNDVAATDEKLLELALRLNKVLPKYVPE